MSTQSTHVYVVFGNYDDYIPSFVYGIFTTEEAARAARDDAMQQQKVEVAKRATLCGPLRMYPPPVYFIKRVELGTTSDLYYGFGLDFE